MVGIHHPPRPGHVVGPFVEGDILQIIFMAVHFRCRAQRVGHIGGPILDLVNRLTQVIFKILNYVMKLAPLGAFGAMAYAIGKYGVSTLTSLGSLIALFYVTSALFVFVVLGSVMAYLRLNIWHMLSTCKEELLLILGTSTAEPALPGLMRKMEYAGVSKPTVGLVVPTGYSFNLDGAAIYLSLAALYIAQATNTNLTVGQQIGLLAVMLLTRRVQPVSRRRIHRSDSHIEHHRAHPGDRHHADLRHRQVHVRVPGAGELRRQRGGNTVRRQVESRARRDTGPSRVRRQGRRTPDGPQRGPGVNPYDPRDHELVRADHGPLWRWRARRRPRRAGRPRVDADDARGEARSSPRRTFAGRQSMRVLIAPDKFKGSLTAAEVADHLAKGLAEAGVNSRTLPLADGGDGSVAAALAGGFHPLPVDVHGATGERSPRRWSRSTRTPRSSKSPTPAGSATLPGGERAPMTASSYGFGEAIRAALTVSRHCLVLALGGSASTDGGIGMLAALGYRFLDRTGELLNPSAENLDVIHCVDFRHAQTLNSIDSSSPAM